MSKFIFILCCFLLIIAPAWGMIEMNNGWSVASNGQTSSSGSSAISSISGDPTITLSVVSSSSLDGPGNIKLVRKGAISKDIDLGGFGLSASFDGDVESEVILESAGTASAAAFVGVTASAMPTGLGSHEIYGTADVTTEGSICGEGSATASASGKANYDVNQAR